MHDGKSHDDPSGICGWKPHVESASDYLEVEVLRPEPAIEIHPNRHQLLRSDLRLARGSSISGMTSIPVPKTAYLMPASPVRERATSMEARPSPAEMHDSSYTGQLMSAHSAGIEPRGIRERSCGHQSASQGGQHNDPHCDKNIQTGKERGACGRLQSEHEEHQTKRWVSVFSFEPQSAWVSEHF
jgi:hypothetical protein